MKFVKTKYDVPLGGSATAETSRFIPKGTIMVVDNTRHGRGVRKCHAVTLPNGLGVYLDDILVESVSLMERIALESK